jgi:vancomycin resistance protein VanJ
MNALAVLYAALTTLWLLLRRLTGDRPWWLQLVNEFTPFLLAPTVPLLLLSLLRRSPIGIVAALIPGSVLALFYRKRFLPRSGELSDRPGLRIMTLNLLCRPRSIDATVRAIRESDADIVMLQEVIPVMGEPLGPDLLDDYPYQAIYPSGRARGTAVLSRLPFEKEQRFQLSSDGWYGQEIHVNWAGRRVALFNVHLMSPMVRFGRQGWPFNSVPRAMEVRQLIDRLPVDDLDVVVAGDFNLTDQSADYRSIRAYLNDAFEDAGSGFGFTYPAATPHGKKLFERRSPPLVRLDHVFYQGRLRARSARVGPNGDSDHFSVIVELQALQDERGARLGGEAMLAQTRASEVS